MAKRKRASERATALAHSMAQEWRTPKVPEQTGILAYHGSPYSFDKFDASKIGSGQGAQAYGHGLYFAGEPQVAQDYRDTVKDWAMIDAHNKRLSELAKIMEKYEKKGRYREYNDPRGNEAAAEYDRLMNEKLTATGRMYEVSLNAKPEEFLDWDRPLSEQPKGVHGLVSKYQGRPDVKVLNEYLKNSGKPLTGADVYRILSDAPDSLGNPDAAIAPSVLKRAGIRGIRYLDQGSRDKKEGQTHNYVVFDPGMVDILRQYDLGGLVDIGYKHFSRGGSVSR